MPITNAPDRHSSEEEQLRMLRKTWPSTQHGGWMEEAGQPGWVTVIIPTYNRAHHLVKALNSVYAQTYRPIELIIIDDGSTDDTESCVENWTCEHRGQSFQVAYIFQENAGPSAARNLALIRSSGEYIQFLDSDDRMHPQKLSVQVQALERPPTCDLVISENARFDARVEEPSFSTWNEDDLVDDAEFRHLEGVSLQVGNLLNSLYRRHLCVEAGPINEELRWMEDVEYNIRMSASASSARFVNVPFLAFSRHGGDHLTGVQDKQEGLDTGFASVDTMERTLDSLAVPANAPIRHKIGTFYLKLARLALRMDNRDQFQRALAGALRNRTGISFRSKIWGIQAVRWIFGSSLCRQFWDWSTGFDSETENRSG